MKRELGIARCGLACCLCSENTKCNGCNSADCPDNAWCENKKCSITKGISYCYQCDEDCRKGLLNKIKPYGFTLFVKKYGEKATFRLSGKKWTERNCLSPRRRWRWLWWFWDCWRFIFIYQNRKTIDSNYRAVAIKRAHFHKWLSPYIALVMKNPRCWKAPWIFSVLRIPPQSIEGDLCFICPMQRKQFYRHKLLNILWYPG